MSVYGATKGTDLEKIISDSEQGEANGTVMYQALAVIGREQGYAEEAELFSEMANMEAMHAGFYAAMNGKYPKDFFELLKVIQQAEEKADNKITENIKKVRALNTPEALSAAEGMEFISAQELFHANMLKMLIERHEKSKENNSMETKETQENNAVEEKKESSGPKVYVCKVCGYEYIGDLDDEPDDYVCPLCKKGKEYFVEQQ